MTGELEAAGALATAGAVAGVIGGREGGPPGEGACANCGAQLTGPFCAQCGQHAYPRRKLAHVIGELMHGLFYLETKTWRTHSGNPRPSHKAMDGMTIGIREKFPTGQRWPGDHCPLRQ